MPYFPPSLHQSPRRHEDKKVQSIAVIYRSIRPELHGQVTFEGRSNDVKLWEMKVALFPADGVEDARRRRRRKGRDKREKNRKRLETEKEKQE